MKKILLILSFFVAGISVNAQSYTEKDFQQSVSQINTAKTRSDYDNLFQKFFKFTSTKTSEKWQAYYYAAVSIYLKTEMQLKDTSAQNLGESNAMAQKFAIAALTSQPNNAEINTLIGLIYFQKIQMNISQDVQKDTDVIAKTIAKAEESSPDNPRLVILKAKLKEKSGDKADAEILFQKAQSGFEKENSSDITSPTWGRQLIQSTK
ncbi:type IV pilus biogenesis/stability protein PilW [Chryseobacterium sp. ERMR1:04]|uniref:tetratricopeptide repeat protein n=1 Tax=Chryseobacterium sp. ERMR1:04 TaxID=1705393 RepID=UPI0006C8BF0F|nr:hypothetical protein [Chryseobacterium sp. ERMR1:04]KPH11507.1 hypothetical protein AMQ68_19080 [Chryseobacterium sp. ERMR1:04]